MKTSLFGVCFALFFTLFSAYSGNDPLWVRDLPVEGKNYGKTLFHPNGKSVLVGADQYIFEYDVATGELLKTRETKSTAYINDYVLTSDTKHIIVGTLKDEATGRTYIEMWDIDTGFIKSLTLNRYDQVQRLAVSSDNKTLFVGTHSPSLYRINLETMLIEKQEDDYGFGDEIALSPDGKTLISTVRYFQGGENTVSGLLDTENFKLLKILPDYLYAPTFNVTGELIGGYTSRGDVPYTYYIGLYDIRDEIFQKLGVNRGIQYAGTSIEFTKDNKYIIATRNLEGYSVWDIATKKPLYEAPYATRGSFFSVSDNQKFICRINYEFKLFMWQFKDPLLNTVNGTLPSESIHLYPNPTQSSLTIQFPSSERNISYSIYDMHGQEIKSDNISDSEVHQGFFTINTESQMSGVYIVRIRVGAEIYTRHYYIVR